RWPSSGCCSSCIGRGDHSATVGHRRAALPRADSVGATALCYTDDRAPSLPVIRLATCGVRPSDDRNERSDIMSSTTTDATVSLHPLDPLTASEVERAWEIVQAQQAPGPRTRVVFIALHEPAKKVVLGHRAGDHVERSASVVLVDSTAGRTYEAVVSLTEGRVLSWDHVPGAQPALVLDEFVECEAAVRADPRWQDAMRKRGVTDFGLTMVDAWSAGNFGFPQDEGRRLVRALTWVRRGPDDNGYARPVANVVTVVDLNEMQVLAVEDGGVVALPPEDANYSPAAAGERSGLKPVEIRQPEGPSFEVRGHELSWQKWRLRIGFTPREGLVIHTVTYEDQGRARPVLYR